MLKSGVTSPNLLDIAMYEHPRIHAFEFLLELWVFSDELEEIIPCGKMNGDSMTWIRRDRPEGLGQNLVDILQISDRERKCLRCSWW